MGVFDIFRKKPKKPRYKTAPFRNVSSPRLTESEIDYMREAEEKRMSDHSFQADEEEVESPSEEMPEKAQTELTSTSDAARNEAEEDSADVDKNVEQRQFRSIPSMDRKTTGRICEKDNQGCRIRSMTEITSPAFKNDPFASEEQQKYPPYICYLFSNDDDAREALLDLNFIHEAEDTGNLICTEPLTFGYYRNQNGKHEAFIGGDQLTLPFWQAAQASFKRCNGSVKNEQRPDANINMESEPAIMGFERVNKVREYSQLNSGKSEFYSIYEAPNGVIAQAFLKHRQNLVTKSDCYVVVKTPEGDFWRDKDGIYQNETHS